MIDFLKKHVWILIIIISILLIPQSISSQSKLNGRVLITGIAVDEGNDDCYKVTAQVLLPSGEKEGESVVLNFVTAESKSITDAIEIISNKLGMTTGLSHLNFIIIGDKLAKNRNLMSTMDVFMRDERISNSVAFYCVDGYACDEIKKTKNLSLSTAIGIENVFTKKQSSSNGIVMPVYKFISDGLSDSKAQMVSAFKIDEEKAEDESSSDSQKSDNSSRIKYYNDIYLFEGGEYIDKIDNEKKLIGVFLLNKESKEVIINVDNVDDDTFKNASVSVHLKDKKIKYGAKFEDGVPVLNIKIKANLNTIREVHNEKIDEENYYANKNYFTDALKEKIKENIVESMSHVIEDTKDEIDVFNLEGIFKSKHPKRYKKYKEKYGDNFINTIKINFDVKLSSKE